MALNTSALLVLQSNESYTMLKLELERLSALAATDPDSPQLFPGILSYKDSNTRRQAIALEAEEEGQKEARACTTIPTVVLKLRAGTTAIFATTRMGNAVHRSTSATANWHAAIVLRIGYTIHVFDPAFQPAISPESLTPFDTPAAALPPRQQPLELHRIHGLRIVVDLIKYMVEKKKWRVDEVLVTGEGDRELQCWAKSVIFLASFLASGGSEGFMDGYTWTPVKF